MAYMCTDSGNLMAIAQQVIAQQQQQQHQRQQQEQLHQIQASAAAAASVAWSAAAPAPDHHHAAASFAFSDPFSFPAPQPFKLSSEDFDSDEWMDSLIVGSGDLSPLFADPPSSTDLDHLIMPRGSGGADVMPVDPLPQVGKQDKEPEPDPDPEPNSKATTVPCSSSQSLTSPSSSHPVLQFLFDCARLVASNPDLAVKTLSQIRPLVSKLGDPIQRVGFYFAEALSVRLSSTASPPPPSFSSEEFTLCYKNLNDACPYYKFSHLTANQAILEATESASLIHIVDFGVMQGIQWAAFLQALATRPGGKPTRVRISGVPSPLLCTSPMRSLTATGNRLREFAEILELNFEFVPVLTPVNQLTRSDFRVDPDESVAVNFMLHLYHLLDDSMECVQSVLRVVKSLSPEVVTVGEYEANLNRVGYVNRFSNALNYYCSVFESIEPAMARDSPDRLELERVIFGTRIFRAVGLAEGIERTDRMEEAGEWVAQMESSGFKPVQFSNYAISQAKLLLWNYDYSTKYSLVDSPPGFLSLAWDNKKLLTVSSWR